MKNKILVLIDRDGTLIYDDKYYLGKNKDWKKKIKILPTVVEGLKLLEKNQVKVYMITNQSGIAIKNFPLLTMARANEVCKEIIKRLKNKGGKIKGYFICDHVKSSYVKRKKEFEFDKKCICNCSCIKPNIGMVVKAFRKEKVKKAHVYVMGDREMDVKTGIRAKGVGILVPFKKEPGEDKKVKKIKSKNKYIAKNFLDAAKFIINNEENKR